MGPIEAHVKQAGVPYTLLRLPMFFDNLWGQKASIEAQGAIYAPLNTDKPYIGIATSDIGVASAAILAHPAKYSNQTLTIHSKPTTTRRVAQAFSHVLHKDVKHVQVPYEAAKKSMLDAGWPEWQVDGLLELYKLIDSDNKAMTTECDDFKKITGRSPLTLEQWVSQVGHAFGRVKKVGILGTGDVSKALAHGLIKHGYEVMIGTRDVKAEKFTKWAADIKGAHHGDFKEAAAFAHVVILSVGYQFAESAISLAGGNDALRGKLVIDVTNPISGFSPEVGPIFALGWNTSAGEKVQEWLPDAHVVKCWNSIGYAFMIDPPADKHGVKPDMWIAGNDSGALHGVRGILHTVGWTDDHVITGQGGIKACRWIEPLCQAWVCYGLHYGTWKHGFAMLRFP